MRSARGFALVAAILAAALQAGVYFDFSASVMPGLALGDDRTFVAAIRQMNVAIYNPWFMSTFFGAPLLAALAAVLSLGGATRRVLLWTVAAVVCAVLTLLITMAVNVPLLAVLDATGSPDQGTDLAGARAAFESVWTSWNTVRAVTSTLGVAALALALVAHGRSGRDRVAAR
jgi:uncharacterized membrane protein